MESRSTEARRRRGGGWPGTLLDVAAGVDLPRRTLGGAARSVACRSRRRTRRRTAGALGGRAPRRCRGCAGTLDLARLHRGRVRRPAFSISATRRGAHAVLHADTRHFWEIRPQHYERYVPSRRANAVLLGIRGSVLHGDRDNTVSMRIATRLRLAAAQPSRMIPASCVVLTEHGPLRGTSNARRPRPGTPRATGCSLRRALSRS